MSKEIKIGDKTYNFVLPTSQAIEELEQKNNTTSFLYDWCKLVEKIKDKKDIWTEFVALPGYKFKNLKIIESPFKVVEDECQLNITFRYDDFEKIL